MSQFKFITKVAKFGARPLINKPKTLAQAVDRYYQCWLPLLSTKLDSTTSKTLVPPLDIAWIWHVHRSNPDSYHKYCQDNFGCLLQSRHSLHQGIVIEDKIELSKCSKLKSDIEYTQKVWSRHYPHKPYFNSGIESKYANELKVQNLENENATDLDLQKFLENFVFVNGIYMKSYNDEFDVKAESTRQLCKILDVENKEKKTENLDYSMLFQQNVGTNMRASL